MRLELLVLLSLVSQALSQVRPLESYNVDTSGMSVSGFSSGGAMAHQYHVAHSASIVGVGIYAGASYCCALDYTQDECKFEPEIIDLSLTFARVTDYASSGLIDHPGNITNDQIFIFNGAADNIVFPGVADVDEAFYLNYVASSTQIYKDNEMNCNHGMPSWDRGPNCHLLDSIGGVYVNRCDYEGSYETVNFIYGNIIRPDHDGGNLPSLDGDYYMFDQSEFFDSADPGNEGVDDTGFVYVPSGCMDGVISCRLHINFHGCGMGRFYISDDWVTRAGYREVGELNDIIMVYPQAQPSSGDDRGCWDWYGYTGPQYATQQGHQIAAVSRMVDRLAGLG